jgi:hypothetical protein
MIVFVVELFLPLETSAGKPVSPATFERIKSELTDRFGGVTAFLRSPADGAWKPAEGSVVHDQVVIFEVMVSDVDTAWWHRYRKTLEIELEQERILARLYQVTVL